MKKLVIIGAGGHSKVIKDCVEAQGEYSIIAFLDDRFKKVSEDNTCVFAPLSYLVNLCEKHNNLEVLIAIGSNTTRKNLTNKIKNIDIRFATVIHPSAIISPSAKIGEGTVIMPKTIINADSIIGKHSILNTGSIIEHDNEISDYVHISPGSILTGGTIIGEGCHVGAGTTTIPLVKIGDWSTIGAGSVVVRDIPSHCTAFGVPAKPIKEDC
jgi:acetyltransferase EpsM